MPKMKTHKGAKRRFKITATGKVMQQQGIRGNKRRRPKRAQRKYGKDQPMSLTSSSHLEKALPYGLK
ncbi:large ribosomal subunit protein bL35 [Candidatus Oscillochloris fontis]|uniref:large ribosomal subunit protein bL35 n=1 Tax=Candidatus Oscillochloris fontis TaxID=2496868 RepID=UPI00101D6815|nr:50S ribosomal protein L35 [Candidatus Oscillochloris fontis]